MKRRDWLLIIAALLIAAIAFLALRFGKGESAYVTVYVNNEVYRRVPASKPQTIRIDQGDGKVNVLEIDEHGVRMASSTCKNQICVHTGTIDPAHWRDLPLGNWIICLPNRVTVEISGGEEAP